MSLRLFSHKLAGAPRLLSRPSSLAHCRLFSSGKKAPHRGSSLPSAGVEGLGPAKPETLEPFFKDQIKPSASPNLSTPAAAAADIAKAASAAVSNAASTSSASSTLPQTPAPQTSHAPPTNNADLPSDWIKTTISGSPNIIDNSKPFGNTSSSDSFSSSSSSSDTSGSSSSTASQQQKADDDVRTKILDAALGHVQSKGWTVEAIGAACDELGYSKSTHGLFPRGAIELVDHFSRKCNQELISKLRNSAELFQDLHTLDKLRVAMKMRLQMEAPYSANWYQAVALAGLPQNLPTSLPLFTELIDEIWHIAGDRSTDMDWYVKRGLLGAVYTSAQLYMLTDHSENYRDTWAFLQRRLEDMNNVNKLPLMASSTVNQVLSFTMKTLGLNQTR